MKPDVVIVDYGMGNLRSVQKAFEKSGVRAVVSSKPKLVQQAKRLVLPGVGAFDHAMAELRKRGLVEPIRKKIRSGAPYLGLCLGLQLLFERSEEGRAKGLGIVPGRVKRFDKGLKVPHIGWNTLRVAKKNCPLTRGMGKEDYFYFVHSYYAVPEDPSWTLARTRYGRDFCSALWKGNVYATQFHPEKSQRAGLRLIRNFARLK